MTLAPFPPMEEGHRLASLPSLDPDGEEQGATLASMMGQLCAAPETPGMLLAGIVVQPAVDECNDPATTAFAPRRNVEGYSRLCRVTHALTLGGIVVGRIGPVAFAGRYVALVATERPLRPSGVNRYGLSGDLCQRRIEQVALGDRQAGVIGAMTDKGASIIALFGGIVLLHMDGGPSLVRGYSPDQGSAQPPNLKAVADNLSRSRAAALARQYVDGVVADTVVPGEQQLTAPLALPSGV